MMNKWLQRVSASLCLLVLCLLALYVYKDNEDRVLNSQERAKLGGRYVQLNNGIVHYELSDKKSNKQTTNTVVLVHGFSSPLYVFDPTYDYLKQHFQVLRFDLFGRGLSDRLDSDYGMELYVEQLHQLLSALDIKGKINLVGLSMGGAIVTHFSNRYPEKVEKVSLISPLFHTPDRPEIALVKMPGLGEYLGKVVLVPKFINGVSESVFNPNSFPDWTEKFEPQTHYKGFSKALVQTARHLSGKNYRTEYEQLGRSKKPVQLFSGRQDKIIPFSDNLLVREAIPNIEFHAIDQAGHLPHYEHAQKVSPLIQQFLSR